MITIMARPDQTNQSGGSGGVGWLVEFDERTSCEPKQVSTKVSAHVRGCKCVKGKILRIRNVVHTQNFQLNGFAQVLR